jgi:hypothetical protein
MLCTVADIKLRLGIDSDDTEHDEVLAILSGVTGMIALLVFAMAWATCGVTQATVIDEVADFYTYAATDGTYTIEPGTYILTANLEITGNWTVTPDGGEAIIDGYNQTYKVTFQSCNSSVGDSTYQHKITFQHCASVRVETRDMVANVTFYYCDFLDASWNNFYVLGYEGHKAVVYAYQCTANQSLGGGADGFSLHGEDVDDPTEHELHLHDCVSTGHAATAFDQGVTVHECGKLYIDGGTFSANGTGISNINHTKTYITGDVTLENNIHGAILISPSTGDPNELAFYTDENTHMTIASDTYASGAEGIRLVCEIAELKGTILIENHETGIYLEDGSVGATIASYTLDGDITIRNCAEGIYCLPGSQTLTIGENADVAIVSDTELATTITNGLDFRSRYLYLNGRLSIAVETSDFSCMLYSDVADISVVGSATGALYLDGQSASNELFYTGGSTGTITSTIYHLTLVHIPANQFGLYLNRPGTLTFRNSAFVGNATCRYAVYSNTADPMTLTFEDSYFHGFTNTTDNDGRCLSVSSTHTLTVDHCTFNNNHWAADIRVATGMTFTNSIFTNNTNAFYLTNIDYTDMTVGYNWFHANTKDTSDGSALHATDTTGIDPLYVDDDLPVLNFALASTSPARFADSEGSAAGCCGVCTGEALLRRRRLGD